MSEPTKQAIQAELDRLMLEYCPEQMTAEQLKNWAEHQAPVPDTDTTAIVSGEPNIGDRVRATMNGEDWYTGVYVHSSSTIAQYGVMRDDIDDVRYFTHAELII